MRLLRNLADLILDVVFPRHCIGCGEGVDDSALRWVCTGCLKDFHRVVEPSCQTCGFPFHGAISHPRRCVHCEHLDAVFSEGMTLFLHRGIGRSFIRELKYHNGTYLLDDVHTLCMQRSGIDRFFADGVIVPTPLFPRKERERGFNQSRRIAMKLATAFDLPVQEALIRTIDTESQTHLARDQRRSNVKNAFAISPGVTLNPASKYILVDDVFTTGATLNACAKILRRAVTGEIRVFTLAHG